MDSELAKLVVIGLLGGVSAVAAHRNVAIYHDGLDLGGRHRDR